MGYRRIAENAKVIHHMNDMLQKKRVTTQPIAPKSNEALANFTPRQLIDELKARGYTGELKYTYTIKL